MSVSQESKCPFASQWDQKLTLKPPPFTGPLKRLTAGLNTCDDDWAQSIENRVLAGAARNLDHVSEIPQLEEPDWVDYRQLERGQQLWGQWIGAAFVALNAALMQGFSIARFAEVLVDSGYAKTAETSWDRYSNTAWHISDWYRFPLNDPSSRSRRSIYQVRCMHELARRRSSRLFDAVKGEGRALSQYDLAEVQMGFSTICISIMEEELGVGTFSKEDKADMLYCWRYIGYHLGILDEYNSCNSLEDAEALFEEYMKWTPARFDSCRPSTFELQRKCCDGFGKYTGIGIQYFEAFLCSTQTSEARGWNTEYVSVRPFWGVKDVVDAWLRLVGTPKVNKALSHGTVAVRELFQNQPEVAKRRTSRNSYVSVVMDYVTWPLLSILFQLVRFLRQPVVMQLLVILLIAMSIPAVVSICSSLLE